MIQLNSLVKKTESKGTNNIGDINDSYIIIVSINAILLYMGLSSYLPKGPVRFFSIDWPIRQDVCSQPIRGELMIKWTFVRVDAAVNENDFHCHLN